MSRSRVISLFLIIGVSFLGSTHALLFSETDCNAGDMNPNSYAETTIKLMVGKNALQIFTEDDLKVAMTHLRQFCCVGLNTWSSEDKEGLSCEDLAGYDQYFPESPMIADHLINIGMRKLDGIEEHCKEFGISCEMANTSFRAKERRDKITEIAEDREGHAPAELDGLFRTYRGDKQDLVDKKTPVLSNAYDILCDEVEMIVAKTATANALSRGKLSEGVANDSQVYKPYKPGLILSSCKKLVEERKKQERNYVRTLMVEKGITYFSQNLRQYSFDYFIKNRFSELHGSYTGLEGCLSAVLNYATNTSCCNM